MSGISLGTGLFSGIDSGSIIQQLLAIEARPRALAQQRIVQLQFQQSAVLEINTRMKALQDAASVAGLLITTEAMVAELPKKEAAMPAMPGGGMGGMDF